MSVDTIAVVKKARSREKDEDCQEKEREREKDRQEKEKGEGGGEAAHRVRGSVKRRWIDFTRARV